MNLVIRNLIFIVASASLGMYSLLNVSFASLGLNTSETMQGQAAQTLESRFETVLPIREFGVNFWSAIRYVFFEEGNKGVVVGDRGWLFTTEEFYAPANGADNLEQNLTTIANVQIELSMQNIELIVVPVPSKSRIHQDKLPQMPDALHRSLYTSITRFLDGQRIPYVDTVQLFSESGGDTFFKTDTHWLPEAAALAANGVSKPGNDEDIRDDNQFEISNVGFESHRGDLLNFLPLNPWFSHIAPAAESLITYEVANTMETDLFAETPMPEVALVGTSYSANTKWNFEAALKLALDEDVINFATEGEGPILPMLNFVDQFLPELPELKMVIWEIPERYLVQPYPSKLPATEPGLALN